LNLPKREFDRFSKARYIRNGTIGASVDPHTYDAGQLVIARSGTPSGQDNNVIGRLYAKYKIRLFHATSPGILRNRNNSLYYGFQSQVATSPGIASGTPYELFKLSDASYWNTTQNLTMNTSYSPIVGISSAGQITIAPGVYLITITAQVNWTSSGVPTFMSLNMYVNGTAYANCAQNIAAGAAETTNNLTCGPAPSVQAQNWTLDSYIGGVFSSGVMQVSNVILTILSL
jgi:hypothetical protein